MDGIAPATGLPLLSGLLPYDPNAGQSETACRRCDKEFNILFARARRCNHCGYGYCSSCTDYQALMPRNDGGGVSGYEPVNVCANCIEMLTITASNKVRLKSQPMSKLKAYMKAYNLHPPTGALEKDDFIDVIIKSRDPNGCLPSANERFYRDNSVPGTPGRQQQQSATDRARSFFSRATGGSGPSAPTPAPAPAARQPNLPRRGGRGRRGSATPATPQRQPQYAPSAPAAARPAAQPASRPTAPPARNNPYQTAAPVFVPPPPAPEPPRPNLALPRQPSPRPPSPAPVYHNTPSIVAVPTLEDLLDLTEEDLSTLTISTLKSILFANHVNAALAVEKSELVGRVRILVEQERADKAAAEERHEQEEREMKEKQERDAAERERKAKLQQQMKEFEAKRQKQDGGEEEEGEPSGTHASAKPPAASAYVERGGLCVICQDEDANIVIVDCGHLCLCRGCSEIVMASNRECPLCRTRIITEARLLRIFKT